MSGPAQFCRKSAPGGEAFSDTLLDDFRSIGDPLGDAAAAQLIAHRRGPEFSDIAEIAKLEGGPCRELLELTSVVPEWADQTMMRPSRERAIQNTVQSGLALLAGSLVESCASAKGAKVLIRAGGLREYAARRVYETAQFVFDIADTGQAPGTVAHEGIVRIRILHAFVRRRMLASDWNPHWGHPVNQEDYASTLLMFSHVYVRSMEALGVRLTEAEKDAVHLGWRYTGWLMGVDEALLTTTREQERALYGRITQRQYHPDADSRALAHGLLQAMAFRTPVYLPIPALYELSRILIGEGLANELEFPRSRTWRVALRTIPISTLVANYVTHAVPFGRRSASWVGRKMCRGILSVGLARKNATSRPEA